MAKKILVVEDDLNVRFTLKTLLESEGYEVLTAANGKDGLQALVQEPSVVLLDLMMPVANGWQFLEAQRNHEKFSKIPVALISGFPATSATLGADAIIPKPLCPDRVLQTLNRLCA